MVAGKGPGAPTKARQSSPKKKNGEAPNGADKKETTAKTIAAKSQKPPPPAELNDDQKAALFHDHLRNYRNRLDILATARKEHDTEKANVRNFLKLAKAEGTSEADLKFALGLETDGGEAAFKALVERQITLARWTAKEAGFQGALFAEDRTPAVDKAYVEGKAACMADKPRRPPYSTNTEQERAWFTGYDDGQAVLSKGFRKPLTPAQDSTPPAAPPVAEPQTPSAAEVASAVGDAVKETVEAALQPIGEQPKVDGDGKPEITGGVQQYVRRQEAENAVAEAGAAHRATIGDAEATHTVVSH